MVWFVRGPLRSCWSYPVDSPLGLTEFTKIASATAIGFAVMGFIGYFVRLLHIPVNNILIGAFGSHSWPSWRRVLPSSRASWSCIFVFLFS